MSTAARQSQSVPTMPVDHIRVGERIRRDAGDISGLARSIAARGLIHPPAVTPNGMLVAGYRRLRAMQSLGWSDIPVTVVATPEDELAALLAEVAENVERRPFSIEEAVAARRSAEGLIRQANAAARTQAPGQRRGRKVSSPNLEEETLPEHRRETRHRSAAVTGMSASTLDKAEALVDAARADPDRYGRFLEEANRTGRVHSPYQQLVAAKRADAIRAAPLRFPDGTYDLMACDPPWRFESMDRDAGRRGGAPYPGMSEVEIRCAARRGAGCRGLRAVAVDDQRAHGCRPEGRRRLGVRATLDPDLGKAAARRR
jgi:ParB-like chromosome segregation protein Spo0J